MESVKSFSKNFYLYKYFNLWGSFKSGTKTIRRLDVFKEILVRKEIFVPSLSMLNDPFELMVNEQHPVSIEKQIGVLSFTSNESNILMWSHYSGSHSGAVIKFKVSEQSIQNEIFKKVHYIQKFEELKFFEERTLVKSSNWSHENEYRAIMGYNSKFESLSNLGLTIEGVILGSSCDTKTYNQIKEICFAYDFKHGKMELAADFTCKCDLRSDFSVFMSNQLDYFSLGRFDNDDVLGPTAEEVQAAEDYQEQEYQDNLASIKNSNEYKLLVEEQKRVRERLDREYLKKKR